MLIELLITAAESEASDPGSGDGVVVGAIGGDGAAMGAVGAVGGDGAAVGAVGGIDGGMDDSTPLAGGEIRRSAATVAEARAAREALGLLLCSSERERCIGVLLELATDGGGRGKRRGTTISSDYSQAEAAVTPRHHRLLALRLLSAAAAAVPQRRMLVLLPRLAPCLVTAFAAASADADLSRHLVECLRGLGRKVGGRSCCANLRLAILPQVRRSRNATQPEACRPSVWKS